MAALGDIPSRAGFIAYAAQARTEDEALLMQQMAELLASYRAWVAPVRRLASFVNLPVAYTGKSAVLLLPVDRVAWTGHRQLVAADLRV